jgi:hypothetical protein
VRETNQENNAIHNNIQKIKIPRNKFNEVKDSCNEKYKSLKKEINEDIRRWKDILCS